MRTLHVGLHAAHPDRSLAFCYRVIAMDRRGRGTSGDAAPYRPDQEFDDVLHVTRHLAADLPDGIDVFGHSIGAVFALGAAARGAPSTGSPWPNHPDRSPSREHGSTGPRP